MDFLIGCLIAICIVAGLIFTIGGIQEDDAKIAAAGVFLLIFSLICSYIFATICNRLDELDKLKERKTISVSKPVKPTVQQIHIDSVKLDSVVVKMDTTIIITPIYR